jgi:hypothetical protein
MARSFPTSGDLASVLAEMPSHVQRFLQRGFKVLGKLDQGIIAELMTLASITFTTDVLTDHQLHIELDEVGSLLSVVNFLSNSLSARQESQTALIEEGKKLGLLGDAEVPNALRFAELIVASRDTIKQQIEQEDLASEVLPALSIFETTVDLRLQFDGQRLKRAIPVALLHIDTDATNQELWFQVSRVQVERLINELQLTLARLKEAESAVKTIG